MIKRKRFKKLFLETLEERCNPSTPSLMTTITLPGANSVWDYSNGPFNASAVIANLDGDGQEEVIAPGGDGNLYAYKYNPSTGSMYLEREFYCGPWAAPIHATPLLVNLPSGPAVFAANINGDVFGWNARTGAILPGWPQSVAYSGAASTTDNAVFGSMAAGDLDGSGIPDIVVPSFNGEVTAFRADGSVMWRVNNDDTVFSGVAIGDINRDGTLSVVVGGDSSASAFGWAGGRVVALSWNGRREWEVATNQVIWSSPVLADLEGNGYLDTIVGTGLYYPPTGGPPYPGNEVLAIDQSGNMLPGWPYITGPDTVDARVQASPAIADLTGNGTNDVIVDDFNGDVTAIQPNGQALWTANPLSSAGGVYASPIVADVTGQGVPDVIVQSASGAVNNSTIAAVNGLTGATVWSYPGSTPNPVWPIYSASAVGGLEGNGTWQLAVIADGLSNGQVLSPSYLEIFNLGSSSLTPPWSQLRQDAYADAIAGSSTYDANLITSLYQGALGRSPSQNELDNIWLPSFMRAEELRPDISGIVSSTEARTFQINNWYELYLGRPVDPTGLKTWLSALSAGNSYAALEDNIVGSNEAFQLAGGNNQAWVIYVYQKVLGRTPASSEVSYWLNLLKTGQMNRVQVAYDFFLSDEYTNKLITQYYSTYKPGGISVVPADDLEAAGWDLRRGFTEEYVLTNIMVSNGDYVSTQQEGSWVRALYKEVLGRNATPSETASWLTQMENGSATYTSIAEAVVRSNEYNTDLIEGYYQNMLGRAPSSSELAMWVGELNNGVPRANIIQEIVESDEFFAKSGGTVNGFINYAFLDLLGHLPNSQQGSYWLNQASSGVNIRIALPQTILFGAPTEYDELQINQWFLAYLGRYPNTPPDQSRLIAPGTPFGAPDFLNELLAGANPADIQTAILTSPEYLELALTQAYWLGARWLS